MMNKAIAFTICILGLVVICCGVIGIINILHRNVGAEVTGDFMIDVFNRHGYQKEELVAELENENGVRLYSDAAGSLYLVYGSTSVPDASYRIVKKSWVKGGR